MHLMYSSVSFVRQIYNYFLKILQNIFTNYLKSDSFKVLVSALVKFKSIF